MKSPFRSLHKRFGTTRLAELLGVHPATVRRWVQRSKVPPKQRPHLAELQRRLKAERAERREAKQRFLELMRRADDLGKLPRPRGGKRKRVGPKTIGVSYTKVFNEVLDHDLEGQIEDYIDGLLLTHPISQAVLTVSQYGRGEHWGESGKAGKRYQSVHAQLGKDYPDSGDFSIQTEAPTPRAKSKHQLSEHVLGIVGDMIDLREQDTIIFVHSVTVFNYVLRTEKERVAWQTFQRRKRSRNTPS